MKRFNVNITLKNSDNVDTQVNTSITAENATYAITQLADTAEKAQGAFPGCRIFSAFISEMSGS